MEGEVKSGFSDVGRGKLRIKKMSSKLFYGGHGFCLVLRWGKISQQKAEQVQMSKVRDVFEELLSDRLDHLSSRGHTQLRIARDEVQETARNQMTERLVHSPNLCELYLKQTATCGRIQSNGILSFEFRAITHRSVD